MANVHGSRPIQTPKGPHPHFLNSEAAHGNVAFLPVQAKGQHTIRCVRNHACDKGGVMDYGTGYGHPLIILGFKQRDRSRIPGDFMCLCAEATTFQDVTLANWALCQDLLKFRVSIPLYQKNETQPEGVTRSQQLDCHEYFGELRKQTFVRVQHIWEIPMRLLWNYVWVGSRGYGIRLTKDSYQLLMHCFGCNPNGNYYEHVDDIPKFGEWRIRTLCGTLPGRGPRPAADPVGALSSRQILESGIDFGKFIYTVPSTPRSTVKTSGVQSTPTRAGNGGMGRGGRRSGVQGPLPTFTAPSSSLQSQPVQAPRNASAWHVQGTATVNDPFAPRLLPHQMNREQMEARDRERASVQSGAASMLAPSGRAMGLSATAPTFFPSIMAATSAPTITADSDAKDKEGIKPTTSKLKANVRTFVPSWEVKGYDPPPPPQGYQW